VEHALLWRLSASRRISGLFTGTPGPARLGLAKLIGGGRLDPAEITEACLSHRVDVAILRTRSTLTPELSKHLAAAGIATITADEKPRQLESTRAFFRSFAEARGLPLTPARQFSYLPEVRDFLTRNRRRYLLSKSMPTADVDRLDSDELDAQLEFAATVLETDTLIVEEYDEEPELCVFALTDSATVRMFPPCERHDRRNRLRPTAALESAGAVAPVPWVDRALTARLERDIVAATTRAMADAGFTHRGILGFRVRIMSDGPKLASMRLGFSEPEASVLMPLLDMDLGALLEAVTEEKLSTVPFGTRNAAAMALVLTNDTGDSLPLGAAPVAVPGFELRDVVVFLAAQEGSARSLSIPPGGAFTLVGVDRDALRARDRVMRAAAELSAQGFSFTPEVGRSLFA
jgi:phosphoribosylamine--glycine ligase